MSDKTSQTTEEELLDQTFGPFDDKHDDDDSPETVEQEINNKGKKKSSNMLIYAAGGIAAVSIVGYVLMSGQGEQMQDQPVAPVANVNPAPVSVTPPIQEDIVQESFLSNQNLQGNPLAGERVNEEMIANPNISNNVFGQTAPIQPAMPVDVDPTPDFMQDLQQNQPVFIPPIQQDGNVFTQQPMLPITPTIPMNQGNVVTDMSTSITATPVVSNPSYENNLVQTELVQQLQQMFEKQTNEIKGSIEEINTSVVDVTKRVEVLEDKFDKATEEQKEINKSLDERLAKLESGLQTKEIAKVETKAKAKPKAAPKPVAKKSTTTSTKKAAPKKATPVKSEVLVDKSKVQTKKAPARAKGGTQIHSIFAGRVWTRNADGSLSTFIAGERLNGEVIKSVEMDSIIMESGRVIK